MEAMDRVGVAGAILVSPVSMYRYDASYAMDVQKAHPGRFGVVKPLDSNDEAAVEIITEWKKTPGAVGIRILMGDVGRTDRAALALIESCAKLRGRIFRSTSSVGAIWMAPWN